MYLYNVLDNSYEEAQNDSVGFDEFNYYDKDEEELRLNEDEEAFEEAEETEETEESTGEIVIEDIVRLYLQQIGEIPLCTPEEEMLYFDRIKEGDQNAKWEFAERNLRLVVSVAKNYTSSHIPLLDLVQDGNIGLIKAIDKFDISKGFKFSTYATWWIRQAITRGIADTSRTIRIPVHTHEELRKYNKLKWEYEMNGESLNLKDAANILGWNKEKLMELEKLNLKIVPLDAPVGEDEDVTLAEFIAGEECTESLVQYWEMKNVIKEVLDSLKPREADILSFRFGLGTGKKLTLAEIGERYNVSRERIRQIEQKVLRRLKFNPKLRALVDNNFCGIVDNGPNRNQKPK